MVTSAGLGHLFCTTGAFPFFPFLALLPKQILLTNLMADLPEMAIATDGVDPNVVLRPRCWDVRVEEPLDRTRT